MGDGYTPCLLAQVANLSGVTQVAAGAHYTVALKADGTVWKWGDNSAGELGDGLYANMRRPVQVVGPNGAGFLTGVIAVAAGYNHTAALKQDGTVWAWGYNGSGQVGDGTTIERETPLQVIGPNGASFLTDIAALVAGASYTVALKADGTVWTWGNNQSGELGDGTTTERLTPVQVLSPNGPGYLTGVQAIAAGGYHTLALLASNASVSGTVSLEGCANPQQSITFTFRPADGSAPLTRTQTLGANGAFSFNDIPISRYNLAIKGAIWLQKIVPVDATNGNVSSVTVTLPAGDANNDNSCDTSDFGVLVGAYGSSASALGSGYDATADFNCDGKVDTTDFGLLVGNYGMAGDP